MMINMHRTTLSLFTISSICIVLCFVIGQVTSEETDSSKVPRSPAIDEDDDFLKDDEEEKESTVSRVAGRFSKIFNDILQIPIALFKAVNRMFSSTNFSRLRDEVNNLNLTYPKGR